MLHLRHAAAIAILLLLFVPAGHTEDAKQAAKPDAAALMKAGIDAFRHGKYSDARPRFEAVLEQHPGSPQVASALLHLAMSLPDTDAGRQRAMSLLRQLHKEFPDSFDAQASIETVERIAGWTFSKVEGEATPKALGDLSMTRVFNDGAAGGLDSIYDIYRVPDEVVEKQYNLPPVSANDGPVYFERMRNSHLPFWVGRVYWQYVRSLKRSFGDGADKERAIANSGRGNGPSTSRETLDLRNLGAGHYAIVEEVDGFRRIQSLVVSTFGIVAKLGPSDLTVFVFDPNTGEPLPMATVQVATGIAARGGAKPSTLKGRTNAQGTVRFDLPGYSEKYDLLHPDVRVYFDVEDVVQSTAHHLDQVRHVTAYRNHLDRGDGVEPIAYLSTDRPVYRPGQKVHFKVVQRDRTADGFRLPVGKEVTVEVRDPRGRLLDRQTLPWSGHGSASGSFELAATPPLGEYAVVAGVAMPDTIDEFEWGTLFPDTIGNFTRGRWAQTFEVRAYRKPEYQVEVATVVAESGAIDVNVKATYFTGGPVAGAKVTLGGERIVKSYSTEKKAAPHWPRPPVDDPYGWLYQSARERHDEWDEDDSPWSWQHAGELTRRSGKTDANGAAQFRLPAPSGSKPTRLMLTAEVMDAAGFLVDGKATLPVNEAPYEVTVGFEQMFYQPEERINAAAKVTTLDGKPAAGVEVEMLAMHTSVAGDEQPLNRGQFETFRFGMMRGPIRATIEFEPLLAKTLRTDAEGIARMSLSATDIGRVRLVARARQGKLEAEDKTDVMIAGPGIKGVRGKWDTDLLVVPQKAAQVIGTPMRVLIFSGVKLEHALVTIEGVRVIDSRIVPLKRGANVIELPTTTAMAPNAIIRVLGWVDGVSYTGAAQVCLARWDSNIDVQVKTDQPAYGPRQKMKVTLETRAGDTPAAAEVELAIVDASIFDIAKDKSADIRQRFHTLRWDQMVTQSSLALDTPWLGTGDSTWVARGGSQSATTLFSDEDTSPAELVKPDFTRSRFADTMHYAAHVITDAQGRATVEIETPDNLARWRIVARAVSGAGGFGVGESATITRQDVVVRLSTPRFYNERDRGEVFAVVHNYLSKDETFAVSLKAEGAAVLSADRSPAKPVSVRIAAGGFAKVTWIVEPTTGAKNLNFEASALSATKSDAVAAVVPVLPHVSETQLGATALIDKDWKQVLNVPPGARPGSAALSLSVTTPGIDTARRALPYLAGYPYGCVEQTMSRFLPALVAADAAKRFGIADKKLEEELPKMIASGLQRLYHFEHEGGGWGWWSHDRTDARMTAYVLLGLTRAKQAGFLVDDGPILRGLNRLRTIGQSTPYSLYAQSLAQAALDDLYKNKRGPFLNENDHAAETAARKLFDETLRVIDAGTPEDFAYAVLAGRKDLAKELPAKPEEKLTPAAITRSALTVLALASADPRDGRIAAHVDWLLRNRLGDRWFSTLDTAWAVLALCSLDANPKPGKVEVTINGEAVELKNGLITIGADSIKPGDNVVYVKRIDGAPMYTSAVLTYVSQEKEFEAVAMPLQVERIIERKVKGLWLPIESGQTVRTGETLRVTVRVGGAEVAHAMIESPIPAGAEASTTEPGDPWDDEWERWFNDAIEAKDDRVTIAVETLGQGNSFTYYLRATLPGEYHVLPTQAFAMYHPAHRGGSGSTVIKVAEPPAKAARAGAE